MCRNIKVLFNFDPPATDSEINAAALQYVRKLSGYNRPTPTNKAAFEKAVEKISQDTKELLLALSTTAHQKNREKEHEKAKARNLKRFGQPTS